MAEAPPPEEALRTAGEVLLGRQLATERRVGVPHYVPGQRSAVLEQLWPDGSCLAWLCYVDGLGHACKVALYRPAGGTEWQPCGGLRAGQHTTFPTRFQGLVLSMESQRLLAEAVARAEP